MFVATALACLSMATLWGVSSVRGLRWEVLDAPDRLVIVSIDDGHAVIHWDLFDNLGNDDEQSFLQRNANLKSVRRRWVPRRRRGYYFTFLPPLPTSPLRYYAHRIRVIGFDLWLPVLLTTIAPTWVAIRYSIGPLRQRRRRRLGLCLACGYDLRGSPERCPECGSKRL